MKKQTLLICDDESGIRDALTLILEERYALVYAANGEEAVDLIRQQAVDLVIIDIKMPKMSGLDALKRMKWFRPELPILMITGYESSETATQATNLGVSGYIVKPFEKRQIQEQVEKLLKG